SRRIRSFGLEARDRSHADRLATAKARPQSQDMSIVRYGSIAARYRARLYHDVGDHSARRAPTKLRCRCNLGCEVDATVSAAPGLWRADNGTSRDPCICRQVVVPRWTVRTRIE